ncbi:MAG: hypothetical protein ACD_63C00254G0009 [uncultured bacterium]|nr:MAG: hypothetical protein ACD_63C00254G0009 [uncultured bacterium]
MVDTFPSVKYIKLNHINSSKKTMALEPKEQIKELIKKSKNTLVITKKEPSGDSMGSMLALYLILKKLEREVRVVAHGTLNLIYRFLPEFHKITSTLENTKDFIISLDVSNTKVGEFSYKMEDNKLNIYIQPKNGVFNPKDVSAQNTKPKYDLIVALNCPDLEYMGKLYEENTEFFYETPIINIDHNASNENYGNVNLVDLTATSTAEIIFGLAKDFGENLVDENIATCILTGIIADTDSFQNHKTTPKSFQIAAELISLGADQQKIIQHLYRTKTLSTLKLWGRLLTRIKYDPKSNLVWTLAELEDFEKANANPSELRGISEELIATSPEAQVILILARIAPKKIRGIIHATKNENAAKFAALFNGGGNEQTAFFEVESDNLIETEKDVIETIRACRR